MNHLAAYIILVGLPVLAVLAVLQIGKTLASPAAVGGTWSIVAIAPTRSAPMETLAGQGVPIRIVVSQSGQYLDCSLIGATCVQLVGEIHGEFFTAGTTDINSPVHITARLEGHSPTRTLSGTIVWSGPGGQRPIEFKASLE